MSTLNLRDYVIIAQMPDERVVVFKYTTSEVGYRLYADEIAKVAQNAFREKYPDAAPVKATDKRGTGGMGWSGPYEMSLGK